MSTFIAKRLKVYICYSSAANERSSYSHIVTHILITEEHISYTSGTAGARGEIVRVDLICYKVDRTECLPE
jgi:hypothetical protein